MALLTHKRHRELNFLQRKLMALPHFGGHSWRTLVAIVGVLLSLGEGHEAALQSRFHHQTATPQARSAKALQRKRGAASQLICRQSGPDIARLERDLTEALERETAASKILNVISSAQAASVQPILDTVVTNAGRLCRALNATIYLCEGDSVVIHAQYGPSGLSPAGTRRPINRDWVTGAAVP
jgi:hypothetical protein